MNFHFVVSIFGIWIFSSPGVLGVRSILTTFVSEGTKECYYETVDLAKHTGQIEFDFTVMQGGFDIELTVEDPDGRTHFNEERQESARLNITVTNSGLVTICFSNEFSYFTAKQVYFELEVFQREVADRPEFYDSESVFSMDEISSHLDSAEHEQWYQRKTAMQSFREAEELHQRVQWAAGLMTLGMLLVSFGQVFMVKRFFEDKTTRLRWS